MPVQPRVDRIKTIYSAAKALNYGWRFTDFLKTPSHNGVSKYIPQLHRITFRFCKQSESSVGMRNFLENRAVALGETEPSVVIYAQPVRNSNPTIRAEYANGRVIQINAKNLSASQIEKDINLLYSRSGEPVVKLESRQSALVPSVQGEWTPVTWISSKLNVAEFPSTDFGDKKTCKVSASDYVLKNGI
ncbi:unnamed protein product [Auanema sp. JU1783]|nr:unnamed protein product [Auanema sp. JU1783]